MINIKIFDSNLLNIDKISFKSTDDVIYNIRYFTMKILNHVNVDNENSRCLIFNNINVYIEEKNENECRMASNDGKKEILKYIELWDEITTQI